VLESGREITLAEKGGLTASSEKIIAHPNFKFLATMNPGGDFGKRELSPALRSRFTEIWIPTANSAIDIALIVAEILQLEERYDDIVRTLKARD
jgi:midasin